MVSCARALCASALWLCACASTHGTAWRLSPTRLSSTRGEVQVLPSPRAAFTVLVFFSADCDCQRAHDARLRELYLRYRGRGVDLLAVDSEVAASLSRDEALARQRAYPFALLIDHGGKLAHALEADYATYSVVIDAAGQVRYRGGLDSDYRDLHEDASFYLRDALDDLLAGRPVRAPEAKTLGCGLRLW
jgi:peroxiredoxin